MNKIITTESGRTINVGHNAHGIVLDVEKRAEPFEDRATVCTDLTPEQTGALITALVEERQAFEATTPRANADAALIAHLRRQNDALRAKLAAVKAAL